MKIQKRLLALFFTTASAHAATDSGLDQLLSLSLEELMATKVRISTKTEQTLAKAPSVVSVLTSEDIRATGATNLVEILQSVPGVYIRMNVFGFRPWITFRGAAGTHALLMINGAPVKDMVYNSGMFWKGVPANVIDRIEVIRGPGSALFGSDASTGVINIITKTAGNIEQSEAGARAGSFDTQEGWLQHGTRWNDIDVNVTADLFSTGGYSPFVAADGAPASVSYAPTVAHNGYDNQDVRFSFATGPWRLQGDYMRLANVQTGLTGRGVIDPLTRADNHRYNLDLFYDNANVSANWALNAELRYLHLDYSTGNGTQEQPPGGAFPQGKLNQQRAAESRTSLEVSGLYSGFDHHSIRLGSGYVVQDLYSVEQWINYGTPSGNLTDTPYAFAPEKARRVHYLFLQDVWTIAPNWELTAGARYDHYSDFGATANPRLALVWGTTDRLVTKLMYGKAFVAPTYLQLYANAPGVAIGNRNLRPERSKTIDLSFNYAASKDLTLGVDFYHFMQFDVIGQETGTLRYLNADSMSAHGVELEAKWQATPTLRLSGYATNRIEDYSALRSYNVPKQTAYLRGDWAFMPKWNWNMQATRIGRHLLPATATPIGAYTIIDTTLRFSLSKEVEIAASIRNLFNKDVREYAGASLAGNLPLPGRSAYVEARYKF